MVLADEKDEKRYRRENWCEILRCHDPGSETVACPPVSLDRSGGTLPFVTNPARRLKFKKASAVTIKRNPPAVLLGWTRTLYFVYANVVSEPRLP